MILHGVVVLYNPNEYILENIKTYIDQIEILYLIDNSDKKNNKLIDKIKNISQKCKYIDNGVNKGIAYALNLAAKQGIENKADWLLTMDQDSRFKENDLTNLIKFIIENDTKNIGIISPFHGNTELNMNFDEDKITMTSGNLLNLDVFNKVGIFLEKLFIDSVDTEYCLRLYEKGYYIKRISSVLLNHNLGEIKSYELLGKKYLSTNHAAIRRYYIMRNRLYIWNKYKDVLPSFIKKDKKNSIKEIIKIILFEDNKVSKILYTLKGYVDYKRNKFGKINE